MDADQPLARIVRPVVWGWADEPVREVASRLDDADQSFVLVSTRRGLGIVTDHDFRRLAATGRVGLDDAVSHLASVPARTIDTGASAFDALLCMVEQGCHHLVVTAAGAPVGVVRAMDLAHYGVGQPLHLRWAIEHAPTVAALAEPGRSIPDTLADLRATGVPSRQVGVVQTALVEAILRRILALRAKPALDGVSWLLLGSLARREPLPGSDIDTALCWADPEPDAADPTTAIRAAAASIVRDLRDCGLSPCPSGANAGNSLFSRSRSGWAEAASRWLRDSTMDGALFLSAVTDSRPVTEAELGLHVSDRLLTHPRSGRFHRAVLDEAVRWRTATGPFREFLVDRTGEHRGAFDLKRGGLVPIVALGRWIAIVSGDNTGGTLERLDRGAAAGLITDHERQTLRVGFDSLYTILYDLESQAIRSGTTPTTYLYPNNLDPLSRRHLRETLRAIHEVQNRIDRSWVRRPV